MRHLRMLLLVAVAVVTVTVGPAAHAAGTPIIACGQTVTTTAFLAHDLNCTDDGIVIGASGITVDLKGFVVRGDRGVGDYGIDDSAGWDSVTVKNGVVRNFDFGVFAQIADKVTVSGLVAVGNLGGGVSVQGTGDSVTKVTAVGNTYGIAIIGDGAKVTSATATQNAITGIFVNGNKAVVKSAIATGNISTGIDITGSSGLVTSSTATGNSRGIFLDGDFDGVKSSTMSGNGTGIVVDGTFGTITSSTASENSIVGIHVDGDAPTISHNRAETNGFDTASPSSDLSGLGILAENFTTPPVGTNVAHANDDPAECSPASLC